MKKLLLLALSIAAIVSCNRQVEVADQPVGGDPESDQIIQLSSGGGAALTMASPNQGVRTKFIIGDQIGLFAAYGKLDGANNVPDWKAIDMPNDSILQTGQYFTNWPAQCYELRPASPGDPADTTDKFAWGAKGQGGVGVDRIYPRAQRGIFVYAYYPYSADTDTVSVDPVKGPLVKVKLRDLNNTGTVDAPAFTGILDVEHLQADVLFAKGISVKDPAAPLDSVKRPEPLAPLYFRHALAQVTFKVGREDKSAACKFVKIQFTVPHSGVMNLIDGKVEINAPSAPTAADSLTYTVTDKETEAIEEGKDNALQVLEVNPLMVLPMTAAQAKTCRLQLTVYYGVDEPGTDPSNHRTFNVNLNFDNMKGFAQGKKNTLLMMVSETGIRLEASIAEWDADGEISEIPVE